MAPSQSEQQIQPGCQSQACGQIVGVAGQEESSYCRFPVQAVQQIEQSDAGTQQNIQIPPWQCAAFHRKLTIMIPNTTASRIMPKESGSRGFFSAKGNGCFPASSSGTAAVVLVKLKTAAGIRINIPYRFLDDLNLLYSESSGKDTGNMIDCLHALHNWGVGRKQSHFGQFISYSFGASDGFSILQQQCVS